MATASILKPADKRRYTYEDYAKLPEGVVNSKIIERFEIELGKVFEWNR